MAGIRRKRKRNPMENNKIKIVFIGTSEFGAIILNRLVKNNYKPVLVITQPDKPAGRRQTLIPSPVKKEAKLLKIGYDLEEIKRIKPDLIITAAYGKIIPKEILEIPEYGALNVHPSLLPKYRGPSPIQTAILNGDKETGITIMLMDQEMDHGPIIAQDRCKIGETTTCQELEKILANQGAKLLIETIPKWIKREIKAKEQDHSKASYTKIIKKEDGKIDWNKSAQEIERKIRAFDPWPGAFTFIKKKDKKIRIKILKAELSKDKLIIKKLQPEAKKPMSFEEFKKGYHEFNPLF
jgi:methionyl-tRNA formyltransferase